MHMQLVSVYLADLFASGLHLILELKHQPAKRYLSFGHIGYYNTLLLNVLLTPDCEIP